MGKSSVNMKRYKKCVYVANERDECVCVCPKSLIKRF